MSRLRLGGALAAASGASAVEFPGIEIVEPEASKDRWLSGSLATLVHAALIGGLVLMAALAPDLEEELIPVQLLRELEQAKEEAAPAPKALAERRSAQFAPSPQALAPQVVNPTVVAQAVPVVAERLQVATAVSVVAPRQISTASVAVETVAAVTSVGAVSPTLLDLEATAAPALRGPIESKAPVGPSVGPRTVATSGEGLGVGPVDLGGGSSVQEGILTTRDVLGSAEGPRLASVNTRVGDSYLRGTGGSGTGQGGTVVDCFDRAEVRAYWEQIRDRMYTRWALPPNLPSGVVEVKLRFRLDPGGSAQDVQLVGSGDPRLGKSAVEALRSASPFPPMSDRVRCLADTGLIGTFRKIPQRGSPTVAN
jgi:TonB family protein